MKNIIKKLKELLRKKKYEELFSIVLKNLIPRRFFRFNDIRVFRLDDFSKLKELKTKINIISADEAHIDKLMEYDLSDELVRDRFNRKDFCHLAIVDDKIVGMIWFSLRRDFLNEFQYSHLKSNDAVWLYSAYVEPRYRMRGVYLHLMNDAKLVAEKNGLRALEAHIDFDNQISISSHLRLGFAVLKRIVALQFLWFSLEFVSVPASHVGINFIRHKRRDNG